MAMLKALPLLVVLLAILLPLSDGLRFVPRRRCNCYPKNVCSLSPQVGHCRARILRYYYNPRTGQCQRFYYGGCGGNGNNFRSLSQCKRKCMPRKCSVKGQVYSTCASPCRKTCNNLGRVCARRCRPGCTCPRGQVIDTRRNRCVPTKWCPAKPGRCPYVRIWRGRGRRKWHCASRSRCKTDSHCRGRKKCCRNSCGGRSCQNPVRYRRRRVYFRKTTGGSGNATVV